MQSWKILPKVGLSIKENLQKLAISNQLDIDISGIDPLPSFSFKTKNNLAYKTYISQELLKNGYLFANSFYICTEHTPQVMDNFYNILDKVFNRLKGFEEGEDVLNFLDGPVCHNGFFRLN